MKGGYNPSKARKKEEHRENSNCYKSREKTFNLLHGNIRSNCKKLREMGVSPEKIEQVCKGAMEEGVHQAETESNLPEPVEDSVNSLVASIKDSEEVDVVKLQNRLEKIMERFSDNK